MQIESLQMEVQTFKKEQEIQKLLEYDANVSKRNKKQK